MEMVSHQAIQAGLLDYCEAFELFPENIFHAQYGILCLFRLTTLIN